MSKSKTKSRKPSTRKPKATPIHSTREAWLMAMVDAMRPEFEAAGFPIPERIRVTMSLTQRAKWVGTHYPVDMSKDKTHEILIRLDQTKPLEVAAILCHELVHASVPPKTGHRGPFKTLAISLGLTGKMTATVPGTLFKQWIKPVLTSVGTFPHAALDLSKQKKQTTRLLKVECEDCGYIARVTNKWIEDVGAPLCPCNELAMTVC